ncbi:gamma-aminobutyric acid receptor subunit beta-4-like [Lineus longissimus]|uniref:gamma-aminobutyric acid receptor subunit beta-4-like n=1 Tax=Lineus longissimus TaxID=88925 RepID=UPI00315D6657
MHLACTQSSTYSVIVFVTIMMDISAELSEKEQKKVPIRIGAHNDTIDQFIGRLVENGYNGKLRPGLETDTPTFVKVSVHILGFSTIDQINMDYSVNMYLRSIWRDGRLAYHDYNETLTLNYLIDSIWTPDIYFINEKEGYSHTITQPNRLMRLAPDGTISYSQKIDVKFENLPKQGEALTSDLSLVALAIMLTAPSTTELKQEFC